MMFDLLVFETLNLKAMHRLWGRKVSDLGFADFLLKGQWMAKKLGQDLIKIDCWEPTTKTCHLCGHHQDMPLNMRTFVCGGCENIECRDVNAAHNILEAGRRLWSGADSKTSQEAIGATTAESHARALAVGVRQNSITRQAGACQKPSWPLGSAAGAAATYVDRYLFLFDRFHQKSLPDWAVGIFHAVFLAFAPDNLDARAIYIYQIACFHCYMPLG